MSAAGADVALAVVGREHGEPELVAFRAAVLGGLARPRKEIPSRYFYDVAGSRLFERICELDAYYPTRTEIGILRDNATDIARAIPAGAVVVEFGSGASVKVRLLLDALDRPAAYVPIDISGEHLIGASTSLARDYPGLGVFPVCADFTGAFPLPRALPAGPRVGFFPGSTIGNFHPQEAVRLLAGFAARLGKGAELIIGVDLKKDPEILHAAYDDEEGVTAAFNRNLLVRINRELGGTFDAEAFAHRAEWDAAAGRVEMHLVSSAAHVVRVCGRPFRFEAGETIHTENSYKYAPNEFRAIATAAGWRPRGLWVDRETLFSVHLLDLVDGR